MRVLGSLESNGWHVDVYRRGEAPRAACIEHERMVELSRDVDRLADYIAMVFERKGCA